MASSSVSLKAWLTQGSRDYILEETLTYIERRLGIHELVVEVEEAANLPVHNDHQDK